MLSNGVDDEVKGMWGGDVASSPDMRIQEFIAARQVFSDKGVGASDGEDYIASGVC